MVDCAGDQSAYLRELQINSYLAVEGLNALRIVGWTLEAWAVAAVTKVGDSAVRTGASGFFGRVLAGMGAIADRVLAFLAFAGTGASFGNAAARTDAPGAFRRSATTTAGIAERGWECRAVSGAFTGIDAMAERTSSSAGPRVVEGG
jgi:hypothetical protein